MKFLLSTTFLAIASLILLGCGGPTKNYNYHSGKGKVDGAVPANGVITFLPEGDPNFVADGKVGADGSFVLTTHFVNSGNKNGVPEGTYKVSIQVPNTTTVMGSPPLPEKVQVQASQDVIQIKLQTPQAQ